MKKLLVCVICISLTMSLAACGRQANRPSDDGATATDPQIGSATDSEPPNGSATETAQPSIDSPAPPPPNGTVKWAVPDTYRISPGAMTKVNAILMEQGLGIALEFVIMGNDSGYMQSVLDYEAEYGPVDIVFVGFDDPSNLRGNLLRDGYCIPLDAFLADNPGIKALFSDNQWKTGSLDGATYLFPTWPVYSGVLYAFDGGVVTEADLEGFNGGAKQLGYLWGAATKDKPVYIDAGIETMLPFEIVAGVALSQDTGKAVGFFSDEGYGELIRLVSKMRASERLVISNSPPKTGGYTARVTSKAIGGTWDGPAGYRLWEEKPYILSNPMGLGIRSDSPLNNEALALLKSIHTNAELANLLIYGEECADYTLVGGYPHSMDGIPYDPFFKELALGTGIYSGVYPSLGDVWNENRPQNLGANPVAFLEAHTRISPFIGFCPDTNGYEGQAAALKGIIDGFLSGIVGGQPWKEDEIEANLAELRRQSQEAGLDGWLLEINRQLDEFRARQ